jgi:hypothetical protein
MARVFVSLTVSLSLALAQSGTTLEVFKPAALPETITPNPVPKTMSVLAPGAVMSSGCLPSLKNLRVPTDTSNAKPDAVVSKKIQVIVDADQAARTGETISDKVVLEDRKRREALMPLIPLSVTSQDFSNIALVFQHGGCVSHFMLANRMALMGIQTAEARAANGSKYVNPKWLYAATLDRALMNSGRAQKFGTQYFGGFHGECTRLYVVDPRTTDAERAQYDVPPLNKAIENARAMATPGCK